MTRPLAVGLPRTGRTARRGAHVVAVLVMLALAVLGPVAQPDSADAAAKPAPCHVDGHKKNGYAEHSCGFYLKTTVYSGMHTRQRALGTIHGGTNWVICQSVGKTVNYGKSSNHWWAYTLSDQGDWGWVNAVFASGGSNDGKFGGVPSCSSTTRYGGTYEADYPPQAFTAYAARFACEVYDDPGADVYAASCQRYHLSNSHATTKATGGLNPSTEVCDLQPRKYEGRPVCDISGRY